MPVAAIASSSSSWRPGQVDRAARSGLAAHLAGLADREHHLVRLLRGGDRLGEPGVGGATLRIVGRRLGVRELAALRVGRTGTAFGDRVEDAHRVLVAPDAPPGPEHVVLVVRKRADHGRLRRRVERQHAVVLEQHHRAAGRLAGRLDRVGPQHPPLGGAGRIRGVGVLEQAGAELDPEDPAHGVVDPAHRDQTVREQLGAEVTDQRAGHLRVDARVERRGRGAWAVRGDPVAALARHPGSRAGRRAAP